jgi:hypothetical protein
MGLIEDGVPVRGFRSLPADLAMLVRNTITIAITPNHPPTVVTRPTHIQQKAFDLLGIQSRSAPPPDCSCSSILCALITLESRPRSG